VGNIVRHFVLALLALLLPLAAPAAELTVDPGHGKHVLTTVELLARADVRDIDIPADVSYHRAMRYQAVPLSHLLEGLDAGAHVQFVARDGFAAEIPAAVLLNGNGSEPWLAIEPTQGAWPALKEGKPGAGPFYLVWTQPRAAHIGAEQWPYQIASIRVLASVASRFPAMRPAPGLAPGSSVVRGFALFQKHCLACHTLNGQGDARLGPDLNLPHNPTEYLRADLLRALIRDPQSLRRWPEAKMSGFDTKTLPDADLDALLAYLKHMAGRKAPSTEARH
jgi:mono/diheme cytochrome c family protein